MSSGGINASGGGDGDSSIRWPIASRRIALATDLAQADTAYPFGLSGNPRAWVAIADQNFAGDIEVSPDGNTDWYPLAPGSVWPISLRGNRSRVVWLRRRSTGAGLLVIAGYSSQKEAERNGKFIGGQSPGASSISLGTVDTELPTAAALGDDAANPSVPGVGAYLMGLNGATWDRLKASYAGQLDVNVFGQGVAAQALVPADSTSGSIQALATMALVAGFNGATFDRLRTSQAGQNISMSLSRLLTSSLAFGYNAVDNDMDAFQCLNSDGNATFRLAVSPGGSGVMVAHNAATADGNGSPFNLEVAHRTWGLQVVEGGTVTTGTVTLQGSLDGTNWFALGAAYDAAVDTSGDIKWAVDKPVTRVRAVLANITGGGNITARIVAA